MKNFSLIVWALFVASMSFAQGNLWSPITGGSIDASEGYRIETSSEEYYNFDIISFQGLIEKGVEEMMLTLPFVGGEMIDFQLTPNTTMSEGLKDKFPGIRSFDGKALDGSHRLAKVDIGPDYFRAMILQPGKADVYIDPAVFNNQTQKQYIVYSRDQFQTDKLMECGVVTEDAFDEKLVPVDFSTKGVQSCELRTYRIAISATGEYTIFHGGTVAQALAAQVTTMNRVNSVYERDLAITMTLVENNELIVFEDPDTDPFTNGNAEAMISENPGVINSAIGANSYDIGHVFGTNSGGLASLQSVCGHNNFKARGVTGGPAPVGDPFDIDYVSHEIGHQFGANHTFNNSCSNNRNNSTAMEPGSGSTVMAYAGICPPNVQNNSDGLFHAISLQEVGTFVSSFSHTCPVKTPLNNVQPILAAVSNYVVPASTPFIVKANATDADGDEITYTFEQKNREVSTQPPVATSTNGPNFRALLPSVENRRFLPSVNNLISAQFMWERLSDVSRDFNFRVTARDNSANGGCTDYKDFKVTVVGDKGPFEIQYPSASGIVWTGETSETILWDVAGTNEAPINTQNVKILISYDWGVSFETLVESAPNTGSHTITVPNNPTNSAMIMIVSEQDTYFTLSERRFRIKESQVGLNDEELNVSIYPNPATDLIHVAVADYGYLDEFKIYSMSGQVVMHQTEKVEMAAPIDISAFETGVYFFEVRVGTLTRTFKLIKH